MTEETQVARAAPAVESREAQTAGVSPAKLTFPTEPFPCPNCGQMLGPGVRVCVACHQPIDPSQIKATIAAAATTQAPQFVPRAQPQVRFPWGVFVIFLVLGSVMTSEGATALGPLKALLVIGAIQVMSSIWVFYDAHQKGIPKPFYWGLGSLFFWLPIFSWYLVRRRQPRAACPLIEAGAGQFLRTLLLIFAVTVFLTLIMSWFLGAGQRGPSQKSEPKPTSEHGGSIAVESPSSDKLTRFGARAKLLAQAPSRCGASPESATHSSDTLVVPATARKARTAAS